MSNVTYYFGAGASINTLPSVVQIPNRIEEVIKSIKIFENDFDNIEEYSLDNNYRTSQKDAFDNFIIDLKWLHEKSKNHASIDTFAKKLSLNGKDEEFIKLKNILSAYLTIEQVLNKPDFRYDYFYAAILNKNISTFPKNIKIVSWNYDVQFEISYDLFCNVKEFSTISGVSRQLNIVSKFTDLGGNLENFGIYKVNGSAIYTEGKGTKKYTFGLNYDFNLTKDTLQKMLVSLESLKDYSHMITCNLSFSWEDDFNSENIHIMNKTIEAVKNTEYLVIIGYSFPFFNREVDKNIISSMKNLKKVYFQSPTANDMIERFNAIRPDIAKDKLIPIFDKNEFYLPNELSFIY